MTDRKTQILRAALSVFARYGLRRSSMADVAQEAGLSRPALYQYFRNKDDLIASGFDLVVEDGFNWAEHSIAEVDHPRARVQAYLTAYLTYYHRLLFTGPHSDELLDLKSRFGHDKLETARARLIARLNALAGNPAKDEVGLILAQAGEGLKMLAPDEETLERRLGLLVNGLLVG